MSSQETDSVYITKCSDHTNSEHGSDSKVVQENNLVKLTSDEVDILWEHLEEWKALKGDKRNMDWSIKGQVLIKKGLAEVGSKVDCMEGHQATEEEYQKAVGAVMEKLTKEELDEASHVAEE
ncbi:hypothetical protein J3A83DRAFT_4186195 [Scleroderma citrinum]